MQVYPGCFTPRALSKQLKWASVFAALFLTACGGGGEETSTDTDTTPTMPITTTIPITTTPINQPANTNGRLLASNCFQCHGTGGTGGFANIRGSEAAEVIAYLTRPASSDIMAAHAQGYTRAQLEAIIAYLQQ